MKFYFRCHHKTSLHILPPKTVKADDLDAAVRTLAADNPLAKPFYVVGENSAGRSYDLTGLLRQTTGGTK